MGNYLHIYIKPNKDTLIEDVETKLSLAIDWYRYDNGLYIIYTTSNVDKWQERLRKFVKDGGKLFICEFEITNRNGLMIKEFWEWLKKPRQK